MLAAGKPTFGGSTNAVTTFDDVTITPDTFARLDGYLDNLASAATTECTTLTQLVEKNATLTASIAALTASATAFPSTYTLLANAQGIKPVTIPQPTQQSGYKNKGPNLDLTGIAGRTVIA